MSEESFFIGWAPTPVRDRRFMIGAALALVAGGSGIAAALAGAHESAGPGDWVQAPLQIFSGALLRSPYPALVTSDAGEGVRTVLLGGYGKAGLDARLAGIKSEFVTVRGTLIARGASLMIAVPDASDAITASPSARKIVADRQVVDEGAVTLVGEILDAKCWFGAMRPGAGKVHKSCAALCIRGGLPIVFGNAGCGEEAVLPLLLNEDGARHGPDLLPFAADPLVVSGRLVRSGGVRHLRVSVKDMRRL